MASYRLKKLTYKIELHINTFLVNSEYERYFFEKDFYPIDVYDTN